MRISWEAHETTALSWESREKISALWESHENLMRTQCKHQSPYSEFSWENAQKCSWESRDILMRFSWESVPIFTWKRLTRISWETHEKLMKARKSYEKTFQFSRENENLVRFSWDLVKSSWDSHENRWQFSFSNENLMRFSWVLLRIFVRECMGSNLQYWLQSILCNSDMFWNVWDPMGNNYWLQDLRWCTLHHSICTSGSSGATCSWLVIDFFSWQLELLTIEVGELRCNSLRNNLAWK